MLKADVEIDSSAWCMKTRDPLVVRADVLVRSANQLEAVVDGIILDLGSIDREMIDRIAHQSYLEVQADHHDGGTVRRRVPIIHH